MYRAHISAAWYCTEFCEEWLTLNSLIIKSRSRGRGFVVLDHVDLFSDLFSSSRWPSGCLLWLCCAHRRVGEGAGEGGRTMEVWGNCPHLLWLLIWCSLCPVLGCRSCTSVMAHINGAPLPSCQDTQPLTCWELGVVNSQTVRCVPQQDLGPARIWPQSHSVRGSVPAQLPCGNSHTVGLFVLLNRELICLIQLFGCLCWAFAQLPGKGSPTFALLNWVVQANSGDCFRTSKAPSPRAQWKPTALI